SRLDGLMGAQPGTYAEELSKPGAIPGIPAITGADQPLDVLRRRPDIIAAERRLAESNEGIGVAISDYYPKVALSGALGLDSTNGGSLFNGKAFQPIGTGALRWRLFDFGKVAAEVAQSRGGYAEALAEYRQGAFRGTEDVENALIQLVQTQVRLEELQGEVASLTRARDLSERAYKAGAIPLTDVLNADSQLLVARNDVESTRADAARAAVRTFRALGGGGGGGGNPPLPPGEWRRVGRAQQPVYRCGEMRVMEGQKQKPTMDRAMTKEHSFVAGDYSDRDLYVSSRTQEHALNSAIVRAEISESFEEYLEIFEAFYADDIEVSSETAEEPIRGKDRVRSLLASFLVPLHVMSEIGGLSIFIRQTAISGDVADETHSAWTLDLVGVSGRTCTVTWRTLRKWRDSLVVYEHHY